MGFKSRAASGDWCAAIRRPPSVSLNAERNAKRVTRGYHTSFPVASLMRWNQLHGAPEASNHGIVPVLAAQRSNAGRGLIMSDVRQEMRGCISGRWWADICSVRASCTRVRPALAANNALATQPGPLVSLHSIKRVRLSLQYKLDNNASFSWQTLKIEALVDIQLLNLIKTSFLMNSFRALCLLCFSWEAVRSLRKCLSVIDRVGLKSMRRISREDGGRRRFNITRGESRVPGIIQTAPTLLATPTLCNWATSVASKVAASAEWQYPSAPPGKAKQRKKLKKKT